MPCPCPFSENRSLAVGAAPEFFVPSMLTVGRLVARRISRPRRRCQQPTMIRRQSVFRQNHTVRGHPNLADFCRWKRLLSGRQIFCRDRNSLQSLHIDLAMNSIKWGAPTAGKRGPSDVLNPRSSESEMLARCRARGSLLRSISFRHPREKGCGAICRRRPHEFDLCD